MLLLGVPQMNKFEQIFSDDHQMLLPGGCNWDQEVPGLMPGRGQGEGARVPKSDGRGKARARGWSQV